MNTSDFTNTTFSEDDEDTGFPTIAIVLMTIISFALFGFLVFVVYILRIYRSNILEDRNGTVNVNNVNNCIETQEVNESGNSVSCEVNSV